MLFQAQVDREVAALLAQGQRDDVFKTDRGPKGLSTQW